MNLLLGILRVLNAGNMQRRHRHCKFGRRMPSTCHRRAHRKQGQQNPIPSSLELGRVSWLR